MTDAYIVGVDMIKFGRFPDKTVPQIGAQAALMALDDCGLSIQHMQALYCGNLGQASGMVGQRLLQEIGQTGMPVVNVANAFATGATAFREAWASVKAGLYDVVLAVGVEQMGKGLLGGGGAKTGIPKEGLIGSDYFASNYDPHVWFNIQYFKEFSDKVTSVLSEKDPKNAASFTANNLAFQQKLDLLHTAVVNTIATLAPEKRILVTAHDAFNYFGKAYGFKVVGLQGLSTATEAGVQDVQKLSEYIIANKVKAIFIESSVPRRTIEALQEAVLSKGHQVSIGGSLYSDALGDADSVEGTYVGMFLYNIKTIVNALQ